MSENGGGSFFLGFLVGAMAGAAAALLLTPQSGEELRRNIEQKSVELKGEATRLAEDAKQQAQRLTEEAKGQVEYVQEQGRIIVSDTVRKAQQTAGDAPSKVAGSGNATPPA
jgi:gas vesicle protein